MTTLDYYKFSQLATAAYVRAGSLVVGSETYGADFVGLAAGQTRGRLPLSLGQYLFAPNDFYPNLSPWIIRHYYGSDLPANVDPIAAADTSGFAATLFERTTDQGTEKVLAIRGTEPDQDGRVDLWQADLGAIGILGMAFPQAVSMVNLILRLKADDSDTTVPQLKIKTTLTRESERAVAMSGTRETINEFGDPVFESVTVYIDFSVEYTGTGLDMINEGEKLHVTGHSLGGHLAILAARLFPDLIDPEVVVFNSPGFDSDLASGLLVPTSTVVDNLAEGLGGGAAQYIDPTAHRLTEELVELFRNTVLPGAPIDFSELQIVSLESENLAPGDDLSLVSGVLTNQQVLGDSDHVPTEPNSHVIEPLTDALALHALLYRLNDGVTFSYNEKLLLAASQQQNRSEEALTEALFKIFLREELLIGGRDGNGVMQPTSGDKLPTSDAIGLDDNFGWIGKGDIAARDAFHDAILRIQSKVSDSLAPLRLESLVDKTANDLVLAAANPDRTNISAIAYRYALKELNPFAVIGADYSIHNQNGELDLYDESRRTGTLTSTWIASRAQLLTALIVSNTDDMPGRALEVGTGFTSTEFTYFVGGEETTLVTDPLPILSEGGLWVPDKEWVKFADDAGRTLEGSNAALGDRLFGGRGSDVLRGFRGNDYLEGGDGDDELIGGRGDDTLFGGRGFDVYRYTEGASSWDIEGASLLRFIGDGADTIIDQDGSGEIRWTDAFGAEHVLRGGHKLSADAAIWQSVDANGEFDGRFTYQYLADLSGGTLLVNGGAIRIERFSPGDLGIELQDADEPQPLPPDRRAGTANFDGLFYNFQNTAAVTFEGLGGADVLQGGGYDDSLYGDAEATFEDLDTLAQSSSQGDFVSGETGNDFLGGSNAVDVLSGGPGFDVIHAGPGDDLIYGDFGVVGQYSAELGPVWQIVRTANPFQVSIGGAFAGANEASWLGGIDLIYGGAGNDTIFADGNDDIVDGGEGDDVIGGDDGDDTLFGDAGNDLLMGDRPDPYHDFVTNQLYVQSGNDYLDGGSGNDWLWGVRGNDFLYGGEGDDVLRGDSAAPWFASPSLEEHGDDVLDGEEGDDQLYGDGGDDVLFGGDGNDLLMGSGGADRLEGGAGDDTLFGDDDEIDAALHGDDWLDGGAGNDTLVAAGGDDTLHGGAGADLLYGGTGGDYLDGGDDDDTLVGEGGGDILFGGDGNDLLSGDASYLSASEHGNDALFGEGGDDILDGGSGNDWLEGGVGNDTLLGGEGDDVYVYNLGEGIDRIEDLAAPDAPNTLRFGAGITPELLSLGLGSLFIRVGTSGDGIHLVPFDPNNPQGAHAVDLFRFEDGTTLTYSQLLERGLTLAGTDGNDSIRGSLLVDLLIGGPGDDQLEGLGGDDTLDGGAGTDRLFGGTGNDTYIFASGYGQDTVLEFDSTPGNVDIVRIMGALPEVVTVSRDLFHLYLSLNGGADRLMVQSWFSTDANHIEEVHFDHGTIWDAAFLSQTPILGTTGNDVVSGGASNDVLRGLAGSDRLLGQAGDDTLDGGTGDDRLEGGLGSDTYVFGVGYGSDLIVETASSSNIDTVQFASGLQPGDVRVTRDLNHLYLKIRGTPDALTVNNWYQNSATRVESVRFADGTVWSAATLESLIGPSEEDDFLLGTSGADVIDGLGGNDTLYGGPGGDTYEFGRASGQDTIVENDSTPGVMDIVQFKADILPADITLARGVTDLHLYVDGGTDRLTISGWFAGTASQIERIKFSDGTVWTPAVVDSLMQSSPVTEFDDYVQGTPGDDLIRSLAGNDVVNGNGGSDVVFGDDGDDDISVSGDHGQLYGGSGNDRLSVNNDGRGTVIDGGEGDDSYSFGREGYVVFGRDSGHEAITSGVDFTVLLKEGIAPEDMYLSRVDQYVYLNIAGADATLRLATESSPTFPVALTQVTPRVRFADGTEWDAGEVWHRSLAPYLPVGEGNDLLTGTPEADSISGQGGDDFLGGMSGNDWLDGGASNDTIEAGTGNDILRGGPGVDGLYGGLGNDLYLFGRGDGDDWIFEDVFGELGNETVRFDANVGPADVLVSRSGTAAANLVLSIADSGDTLTYFDYFAQTTQRTLQVEFADGTIWADTALYALAGATIATQAQDFIYGDRGDDSLAGLHGDDRLYSGDGDDLLDGGTGNDLLHGGAGDDVYVFGPGYGFDSITDFEGRNTIRFTSEVSPGDVALESVGSALRLTLVASGERITWSGALSGGTRVERTEFADGTVWDLHRNSAGPILGTNIGNTLVGTGYDDVIDGLGGSDFVEGGPGNDTLYGGPGSDTLIGRQGDDFLDGGLGNDVLHGDGGGLDTYFLDRGYGQDTVYNGNGRVLFGTGISPADVTARGSGTVGELALAVAGTADRITLVDWFGENHPDGLRVTAFEFADGTIWDAAYVEDVATAGTSGDDFLYGNPRRQVLNGGAGNDHIVALRAFWPNEDPDGAFSLYGEDGNDVLAGGNGDDWLEGGTGDDWLEGQNGNDTYYFARGFGQDQILDEVALTGYSQEGLLRLYSSGLTDEQIAETIIGTGNRVLFAPDISPGEIEVSGEPGSFDVQLALAGTADRVTLIGWLLPQQPTIQWIEFADGTTWDVTEIAARAFRATAQADSVHGTPGNDTRDALEGADILYGYDGNDTLSGAGGDDVVEAGAGHDTLDGGAGNDRLFGGEGNDTYIFGRGSAHDRIVDFDPAPDSHDRIVVSDGVAPQDLILSRDGEDLIFAIKCTQDSITVRWFTDERYRIEEIRFADGSSWDLAAIAAVLAMPSSPTTGNDNIEGSEGDDIIVALDGDDIIHGCHGNDWLDGGLGADYLAGGPDDDTYIVDQAGDVAVEQGGEGVDTVISTVDYILAVHVENLTLAGTATQGTGNELDNHLVGNDLDNLLVSLSGRDVLDGGLGNDQLIGGSGDDTYIYAIEYGSDRVTDYDETPGNHDSVDLVGVDPGEVILQRLADDLVVSIEGEDGVLTLANWFLSDSFRIEAVRFADGTIWGVEELVQRAIPPNRAPILVRPLDDVMTLEDAAFAFQIPPDAFSDPDAGDTLTYGASLADGAPLPDWLQFDIAMGFFFGTPENGDVGTLRIRVTATDPEGESASGFFDLAVANVNDAPMFVGMLPELSAIAGMPLQYRVADGVFSDVDNGDSLSVSVRGAGGLPLPSWLCFDASTGLLTGTPGAANSGVIGLEVVATDLHGASAAAALTLAVSAVLTGTNGADTLNGSAADDLLNGRRGNDQLSGLGGEDVLAGGEGRDRLLGGVGNDLLMGQQDGDNLSGDAGNDLLIGGKRDDTLTLGPGADIVAFNRGDGKDVVFVGEGTATISLGGGVAYRDLAFRRDRNDLVLEVAAGDKLVFADWYAAGQHQPQVTLQLVAESMAGFLQNGADPLLDDKIEAFDFNELVANFDSARATAPKTDKWKLMNDLLDAHLAGSDSEAIGGDLAYQYGLNGTLGGIGFTQAQEVLNAPQFGTGGQVLRPLAELRQGQIRLS